MTDRSSRAQARTGLLILLLAAALLGAGLAGVFAQAIGKEWTARGIVENERAACRMLVELAARQFEFRGRVLADGDRDGRGEFGYLQDVSEIPMPPTLSRDRVDWADLRSSVVADRGVGRCEGYFVLVWLPGETRAVPESHPLLPAGSSALDRRETRWVAYAWPRVHGSTGMRAFVVNETGRVLFAANDEDPYRGRLEHVPDAPAAFDSTGTEPVNLGSGLAWFTGGPAVDGRTWTPVPE